jgi:hypothetical protein
MKLNEQEEKKLYIGLIRDYFKGEESERRERLGLNVLVDRAHERAMYIINNLNGTYTPPVYSEDEQ